jgi:glycosyltransferase involved in cell wall biosynthesis
VPVISSNAGGLPEVNIHGVTGFLSDIGDVDDMAKNALLILENPEMHQKFSAAALANAEKYSLENIVPHYEAYYEEVIKKSLFLKD